MKKRDVFVLAMGFVSTLNLFLPVRVIAEPSILWISEFHDPFKDRSILNTDSLGYSGVASLAEQMGATNIEVDDSITITNDLLAPHALVVLGLSETGNIRTQAESETIANYVGQGGRLLVMCGGYGNGGAYANSVSTLFGVTFNIAPSSAGGTQEYMLDPLTKDISTLWIDGPNYLSVTSPAVLLGKAGQNGILARRDYGAGSAAFWGDDWIFMNCVYGGDNRQFAENVFEFANIPEPTTLSILLLGSIGLIRNRRRTLP